MNSDLLLLAKSKLKRYLQDKEIFDIIIFGSSTKGKVLPNDIDIALITNKELKVHIEGFHISILKPVDFFKNIPSLVTTLLREGYSLKHNKFFSALYQFTPKILFIYELSGLSASDKVRAVNILRGKKGIIEEHNGKWLAKQVFLLPIESEDIIQRFLLNFKIKFKKFYTLMH